MYKILHILLNYIELCKQILQADKSILFASAASTDGYILAAEYQEGYVPSLTTEEAESSIMQTLIRMNMRNTLQTRFGRVLYSFAEYEKVKRATFLLYDDQQDSEGKSILKLTLEKSADHDKIIENKIKPLLTEIEKRL